MKRTWLNLLAMGAVAALVMLDPTMTTSTAAATTTTRSEADGQAAETDTEQDLADEGIRFDGFKLFRSEEIPRVVIRAVGDLVVWQVLGSTRRWAPLRFFASKSFTGAPARKMSLTKWLWYRQKILRLPGSPKSYGLATKFRARQAFARLMNVIICAEGDTKVMCL